MKVKVFKTKSEIILLITMISITNCLHTSKGSNLDLENINNSQNLAQNKTQNDAKYEEISTIRYFKNFISNIIDLENIFQNLGLPNNAPYNSYHLIFNLRKSENSNKIISQNYNRDSVKIANVENCNLDNCEIEKGKCISVNQCRCHHSFINIQGLSKKACDYRLSYQLRALILEMIFPIGFGHFYCKRYLIGFLKFCILFLIPIIVYTFIKAFYIDDASSNRNDSSSQRTKSQVANNIILNFFSSDNVIKRIVNFYFLVLFSMWYLFDLVVFAANRHKDGSGYDLIPI